MIELVNAIRVAPADYDWMSWLEGCDKQTREKVNTITGRLEVAKYALEIKNKEIDLIQNYEDQVKHWTNDEYLNLAESILDEQIEGFWDGYDSDGWIAECIDHINESKAV